jgi:hypothetical protein
MEEKLIPTFQQIPYTELVKRIDEGSNGILDLSNMLYDRKEIHEKEILFEQRMSKSNVFTHEIPTSTSERMLGFFKNFYIYVARGHIKTHKEFNDSVIKEIDDLKQMRTATVNRTKQHVNTGLKDIHHAEDALEKAKKAFAKAKADYERGVDKLKTLEKAVIEHQRAVEEKKRENLTKDPSKFSMGRMFQSAFESHPAQDRDRQIKKVERRHDEMIQAANSIIERKRFLLNCMDSLDSHLHEAAAIFQELEVDRMRRLKTMLRRFCDAERVLMKMKEEQLALLEESINYQDPDEDMLLFITQQKLTEATHKYGGAVKLLDEYLYRKRDPSNWSFTTCDQYKIVDHAQLVASLTADIMAEIAAPNSSTGVADVEPTQRLAEYDTVNTAVPAIDETMEDILEEERQTVAAMTASTDSNSKNSDMIPEKLMPLIDALTSIFVREKEESSSDQSPILSFEQWEQLLETEESREHFLLVLDDKRCVSASLDSRGYSALAVAMQALLSYCELSDDAKKAMRVLNMANTFYLSSPSHELTDDAAPSSLPVSPSKQYLQIDERLKGHPIWRKQHFWENALKEGVFAEMEKMQPSHWDELSPESLKEAIINIHNLVFGQLGTLSLTMHEQSGLEKREVASHVVVMSRKFQLCEDQEFELLHSITNQVIKEYQPPPIIPNAPVTSLDEGDGASATGSNLAAHRYSVSVFDSTALGAMRTEPIDSLAASSSPQIGTNHPARKSQRPSSSHYPGPSALTHEALSTKTNARDNSVVDGTATVVGVSTIGSISSSSGVRRTSHSSSAETLVVAASVIGVDNSTSILASSVPATPTATSSAAPIQQSLGPSRSSSSSNPFSFMLGMTGSDNSGRRSRTASNNTHDDFFATL